MPGARIESAGMDGNERQVRRLIELGLATCAEVWAAREQPAGSDTDLLGLFARWGLWLILADSAAREACPGRQYQAGRRRF